MGALTRPTVAKASPRARRSTFGRSIPPVRATAGRWLYIERTTLDRKQSAAQYWTQVTSVLVACGVLTVSAGALAAVVVITLAVWVMVLVGLLTSND